MQPEDQPVRANPSSRDQHGTLELACQLFKEGKRSAPYFSGSREGFGSPERAARMAYRFERQLGQRFGFDPAYMKYVDEMLDYCMGMYGRGN